MTRHTKKMYERNYFGMMMVETGEADALITGVYTKYADAVGREGRDWHPSGLNHIGAMHPQHEEGDVLPGRHAVQPPSFHRNAYRHCQTDARHGEALRLRTGHGHVVVLQLRVGQGGQPGQRAQGGGNLARTLSRHAGRWRNAGELRAGQGVARPQVPFSKLRAGM